MQLGVACIFNIKNQLTLIDKMRVNFNGYPDQARPMMLL